MYIGDLTMLDLIWIVAIGTIIMLVIKSLAYDDNKKYSYIDNTKKDQGGNKMSEEKVIKIGMENKQYHIGNLSKEKGKELFLQLKEAVKNKVAFFDLDETNFIMLEKVSYIKLVNGDNEYDSDYDLTFSIYADLDDEEVL